MKERTTVREFLSEKKKKFAEINSVIFTTFTFDPVFFENNALSVIFEIEDNNERRRGVKINDQLSNVNIAIFYDGNQNVKAGGTYKYQTFGIQLEGKFFHPKNIIIAGKDQDENHIVFVSAGSANLTMSGWGRQEEVITGIYIESRRQQPYDALKKFVDYLQNKTPGEVNAIDSLNTVMRKIGNKPLTQCEYGELYFSGIRGTRPFQSFIRKGRVSHKWDYLYAFSPYWNNVCEQAELFNAREVTLIPAKSLNGKYGLTAEQFNELVSIQRNRKFYVYDLKQSRKSSYIFRHAKLYIMTRNKMVRIGIGSCNFTSAGLSGSKGNMESMIVYNGRMSFVNELDNNIKEVKLTEENTDPDMKEDLPRHLPFFISVGFNWKTRKFEIEYQSIVIRSLSNVSLFLTSDDKGPTIRLSNKFNGVFNYEGDLNKVGMFKVQYEYKKEKLDHYGITFEYNLDYSEKEYTVNLSAKDILHSWGIAKVAWISNFVKDEVTSSDMKLQSSHIDITMEGISPDEDVFNYYEDYRNIYSLRQKLSDAKRRKDKRLIQQYLEIRADSIKAFMKNISTIDNIMRRYLLTVEIDKLIYDYKKYILDSSIPKNVRKVLKQYRQEVLDLLIKELDNERNISSDRGKELLRWFETNIKNVYS